MGAEGQAAVQVKADPWATVAFLVYLAVIFGVGIWARKRSSKGMDEFFLGGRKMNPWVVALSAVVSGRSAWLMVGLTGMAYARGASTVWAVVGYILAELLMCAFMGPRLRRQTEKAGDLTVPDFLASRFGSAARTVRAVSAVIILVFMLTYVVGQIHAGGKTFAAGFGMSRELGVLLTALIILVYTVLGGYVAVAINDFIQACIMLLALLGLPAVALFHLGGMDVLVETLRALDPRMVDPFSLGLGGFVGFLGIGLGSPGNPHILVRYMSISDARQLGRAALVGTVWNVLLAWGAIVTGLAGRALYPIKKALPGGETENLYPYLASEHLPPLLFGMVVASVFAAILSTADSQLLVAASSAVRDLYQKLFKRSAGKDDDRRMVLYSRIAVFVLLAAAVLGALKARQLVFWLVLLAWSGLGASFGPAVLLALFWKRTNGPGVVAGMVTGAVVSAVWNQTPFLKAAMYELIPAFAAATLVTVVVSLLTRPEPDRDRESEAKPH